MIMMSSPYAPFANGPEPLRTGCKINLFLRIGALRADGYHDLETLFLPLDEPHDRMLITETKGEGLVVDCNAPGIDPRNNTLTRAYALFVGSTGFAPGLRLVLEKGVPHGAGLGGGSANAAGLLLFLRRLAMARNMPEPGKDALLRIAAATGADVPFFLEKGPALATGVGDILTRTRNPYAGKVLVLLCPALAVSTAWAYKALDALRARAEKSEPKTLTSGLREGTTPFAHDALPENDFEAVVLEEYPQLLQQRNALTDLGAEVALLSGTGSTVFGIFNDRDAAQKAADHIADSAGTDAAQRIRTYIQVMR